jgi:hypothetical protein
MAVAGTVAGSMLRRGNELTMSFSDYPRTHLEEKRATIHCRHCKRPFKTEDALKRHEQKKHSVSDNAS